MQHLQKTSYAWSLSTEPQSPRTMLLLSGSRSTWSGGRVLGGTSAINAMMYMRGAPADYDEWGLEGWGAEDVWPLFRKSEAFIGHNVDERCVGYTGRRMQYVVLDSENLEFADSFSWENAPLKSIVANSVVF